MRPPASSTSSELASTDAELLALVANAHRDALSQLYRRHAAAMKSTAWRITRDAGEAEDLLHDVFLEIWRTAADYDPSRGSVRTWLLVRTRSRSLDRRRTISRRSVEELANGDGASIRGGTVSQNDDELTLRHAVTRLPAGLRELLELGYYVGLSSAEIASTLELPLGTVKSRVARAFAKLRAELAQ